MQVKNSRRTRTLSWFDVDGYLALAHTDATCPHSPAQPPTIYPPSNLHSPQKKPANLLGQEANPFPSLEPSYRSFLNTLLENKVKKYTKYIFY